MMRIRDKFFVALVLMALLPGLTHRAAAQNVYAAIHGTVTDASGAVVPNAKVTVVNSSTGITKTATTDSKGYYIVPQLQAGGPYTVTVEATGFQKFETTGVTLEVNNNVDIDAPLKTGSSTTVIQVQAASVQVETSDTQLKSDLSAQTIEDLPLLGRDVVELQKTAPGVVESSDRFGTFSTNGNQTPQNAYLLDGTDINDGPLQSAGITPNLDAIGEFQVITSTLNPEYYRNSGAIVSESIKSGTNNIHGSGFEFYRDTFMNNGNYFSPTRPPFHQNIYGGTLGGPILKDKLFAFVAYQGLRSATATTNSANTFSAAELAGSFTGSATSTDPSPFSSNPLPFAIGSCPQGEAWSTCFPNGTAQFSPNQFNSIAATIIQKYAPAATTTIGSVPATFFNAANTNASDQGIVRIDYHVTPKDELWASSIFQSDPSTAALPFDGANVLGFGENNARHFKIFNASYTHTFSNTTINELRVGYYRFNYAAVYPQQVQSPASYGFSISPQDANAGALPVINILNGPTFGFSNDGPQPRKDENYDYNDNFTKIVGSHNMKFGAHIEKFVVSNPFYADNNGSYAYNGTGAYSSGNSVLDFFLGIPDTFAQQSGGFIDATAWELYGYAQDNWKVNSSFTLNYGIAWDSEAPNANKQFDGVGVTCFTLSTQTSTIFPGGPPGLLFPGDKGCNNQEGATTKYNHFGPRVGFAWSPESGPTALIGQNGHHDFSVRAGFGIYYNRDQEEGSLQNLSSPPFSKQSNGAADVAGGSPGFANPYADIANSVPAATNPFPFTPPQPGAQINWLNFAGLDINAFDKNYTTPIVYNFNLNAQRALPGAMVLQVGYVGSLAHHLVTVYDGDPITAAGHAGCLADTSDGGCAQNTPYIHPLFPQYTALANIANPVNANGIPYYYGVGVQASRGSSNYNSLQVQLQKAQSHGLSFNISYTYSHGLDNSSGLESSGFNGRGINFVPGFEYLSYGDSDYDARHRLATYYTYQIPILASMKNNYIVREALGGWNVSGVTALQTGFPINIEESGDYQSAWCDAYFYYYCADSPNTTNFSPKSLAPRELRAFNGGTPSNYWFDPTPFSAETLGTFGNTKRNYFHGPGFNYTNLSLFKDFPLGRGEGRYIQLRLESFNVFNHANFSNPDGNFLDGGFGVISSVVQPVEAGGDPQPGRAVQIAGKFYF